MRLIDANELIEIVKGSEELLDFQKDELIACVDACDTAYNVEKVLGQIKDYFFEVIDNCEEENIPHEILEYNKAICEIVRKGGVE